jgi:hypothetical protein
VFLDAASILSPYPYAEPVVAGSSVVLWALEYDGNTAQCLLGEVGDGRAQIHVIRWEDPTLVRTFPDVATATQYAEMVQRLFVAGGWLLPTSL